MSTCNNLREARQAAGLTYRQVSQAAGLPLTAIAHYERGARTPRPDALNRWQEALKKLLADRISQIFEAVSKF